MSLIAGMEDIMTHIKNQELRIQKLEEENKKLKDENKNYDKVFNHTTDTIKEISLMNNKKDFMKVKGMCILSLKENEYCFSLYNDNEKLKKENKKMKDMLLKFKKQCDKVKDK